MQHKICNDIGNYKKAVLFQNGFFYIDLMIFTYLGVQDSSPYWRNLHHGKGFASSPFL